MPKLFLEEFTGNQWQWLPLMREAVAEMREILFTTYSLVSFESFTKSLYCLFKSNKLIKFKPTI